MMDAGERAMQAYNRGHDNGHRSGHRCGYTDAVSEVWAFLEDIPTGDPRRSTILALAMVLQDRRSQVLAHCDVAPEGTATIERNDREVH